MTELLDINDRVLTDIRMAADIVDVIGEHTTLKKAGKSWKGLCPFHKEKTPSFTVDRDRGLYYCFGCNAGGDIFGFIRAIERLDFRGAVETLARRYNVPIPKRARRPGDDRRDEMSAAVAQAAILYTEALWKGENRARGYLKDRGVSEEMAHTLGLGFAPDKWDFLSERLSEKFSPGLLTEAGLLQPGQEGKRPYDRFRDRLLFPIRDERGNIAGFGGRSLSGEEPKYLNSPESPLFSKNRLLYGIPAARDAMKSTDRVVLVEGYFDHLALLCAGVAETVATMGTALTPGQAERIRRWVPRTILCYDGDAAGKKATLRAIPILLSAGLEVSVAAMPADLDPHDYLRDSGPRAVAERIEDASHFLTWLLAENQLEAPGLTAEEKRGRVNQLVEIAEAAPDRVLRYELVRQIAQAAHLPVELLWRPAKSGGVLAKPPMIASSTSSQGAVARRPLPEGEKRLLRFLLQSDGLQTPSIEKVRQELLSDSRGRMILAAAIEAKKEGSPLDFSLVVSHLTGLEERALLSELAIAEEGPAGKEEDIASVLKSLEKKLLERQAEALQREIEAAEAAGNREEIERLYRSKLSLVRKGQELGREGFGRNVC